jgi:hypothetical protein
MDNPGVPGSTRKRGRVFHNGYVVLAAAKLYEPIWKYDLKALGNDLSAHLVYGLATAAAWRLV